MACAGSASPVTVDEMVDHINTLPLPVTAPCLVRSLARPLQVVATDSPFSAQPAYDRDNPRIFLFSDTLAISLVPLGNGSRVVEFGEQIDALQTRKGELALPIETQVAYADPHDKIRVAETHTGCSMCHTNEQLDTDGSWISDGLRPDERTFVSLAEMRTQRQQCDPGEDPERCALYDALFDGKVEDGAFPDAYPTIYDPIINDE